MPRTYYTIDDLYMFCKTNNFTTFSSKKMGAPLIVQSIESFESEDTSTDGILPVNLKSCHILKNRNGSTISKENMEKNMGSFKGRPILGAIYKTDTGEYEFRSHDVKIVEDGDDTSIEYIEGMVGVISELKEPYLKYDEVEDKTYLMASGSIFEDYTHAAEILKRRKTCKCSVEIAINEMSWDGEQEALSIDDFSFRGVTILGYEQDGVTEIEEGMKGSKITIDDFSANKNSMFAKDYQAKMLETLEMINSKLSTFTINNSNTKGVNEEMNHFDKLLEEYGVTKEDIDFEVDGLSDEDLDAAFEEHFKCKKKKCSTDKEFEDGDGTDAGSGTEEDSGTEDDDDDDTPDEPTVDPVHNESDDGATPKKNYVLQYELSHDDIRQGLYALLQAKSDDDYYWAWIIEVFDSKFIYEDCSDGKFYRQGYSKDGDNLAFDGDKVEVFNEWLSKEEKDALDSLKQSYAELKKFKDNYDMAEIKSKKDAILNNDKFAVLADNEDFKTLKIDVDNYSVDDIEAKCKQIFADYVLSGGEFSTNVDKKTSKIGIMNPKPTKKSAYGNLFD